MLECLQQRLCHLLTRFGFFHSCQGPESRVNLEVVKTAWITPGHYVLFMASSSLLLCCSFVFLTYYLIPKCFTEYERARSAAGTDAVMRDWIKTQIDGLATSTIPKCLAEYDRARTTVANDAVTRDWIKTQTDGLATGAAIAEFNSRLISISDFLHAHKKEMNQTIPRSVDQIRQIIKETFREYLRSPPSEFLTISTYKDGLATLEEQLQRILHELAIESSRTTGLSDQLSSFLTPPIGMEDHPSTIQHLFTSLKNDILAVNSIVRAVQNSLDKAIPYMTKADDLEIKQTLRAILSQVQEEEESSARIAMEWKTFLLRLGEITKQLTAAQDLLDSSARNLSEIKTKTGTLHLSLTEQKNAIVQMVDDRSKQSKDPSNLSINTSNTKQEMPTHQPSTGDLPPQGYFDSMASQLYLINNGLRALVKRQEENDVATTLKLIGDVRLESEHSPASDAMESVTDSHGSTPLRCVVHIKIGEKSFAEAVQWATFGAPIAPLKNLAEDIAIFRKFSEDIENVTRRLVSEEQFQFIQDHSKEYKLWRDGHKAGSLSERASSQIKSSVSLSTSNNDMYQTPEAIASSIKELESIDSILLQGPNRRPLYEMEVEEELDHTATSGSHNQQIFTLSLQRILVARRIKISLEILLQQYPTPGNQQEINAHRYLSILSQARSFHTDERIKAFKKVEKAMYEQGYTMGVYADETEWRKRNPKVEDYEDLLIQRHWDHEFEISKLQDQACLLIERLWPDKKEAQTGVEETASSMVKREIQKVRRDLEATEQSKQDREAKWKAQYTTNNDIAWDLRSVQAENQHLRSTCMELRLKLSGKEAECAKQANELREKEIQKRKLFIEADSFKTANAGIQSTCENMRCQIIDIQEKAARDWKEQRAEISDLKMNILDLRRRNKEVEAVHAESFRLSQEYLSTCQSLRRDISQKKKEVSTRYEELEDRARRFQKEVEDLKKELKVFREKYEIGEGVSECDDFTI